MKFPVAFPGEWLCQGAFTKSVLRMAGPSLSILGTFLLMGLSGCGREKAVEIPPPIVTVTQAIQKEVQDWDEYTGRLSAIGSVEIRPRVSGYITEIKFKDGDIVTKGQPLFIIDPRPYQADYDKAQGL